MAIFRKIPADQAPPPTRQTGRLTARMRLYEDFLRQLGPHEVGELRPEGNETTRALVLRVARAAKRLNVKVEAWVDNNNVYFRVHS